MTEENPVLLLATPASKMEATNMILKWPDGNLLNFKNHWRFKNCSFFFFGQYRKNPLLNRLIDIVLMGVIHLCIVSLYNYAEKKTVIQYWPSSWSTRACSFHSSIVSKCPAFAHKKTFLEYTHIFFPILFSPTFLHQLVSWCWCVFAWFIHLSTLRLYQISFSCRHVKLSGVV